MLAFRPIVLIAYFAVLAAAGLVLAGTSAAQDVRKVCSEKYQAAKDANALGSETWPQFYSRCTAEAKASQPQAEAPPAPLDIRHICSEQYQAAKAAGTLGGESWPRFYSRCTAETKANPPAVAVVTPEPAPPSATVPVEAPPAAPVVEAPPVAPSPAPVAEAPVPPPPPVAEAPASPPPATTAPPSAAPLKAPAPVNPLKQPSLKPVAPAAPIPAQSAAVFPVAVAPQYAGEKPLRARQKTCAEQFKANKTTNANGGMKWIQKGGGYWSECNKRLKG